MLASVEQQRISGHFRRYRMAIAVVEILISGILSTGFVKSAQRVRCANGTTTSL